MERHELTEEQWNKVKGLLPPEKLAHGGKPGKDNRGMLNVIKIDHQIMVHQMFSNFD